MKTQIIKDESELPKGAVRVHLYNPKNVLMPRGSMKKESIAIYILDHLMSGYESWTDKEYGDNPPLPDLIKYLYTNLMGEVEQAWISFIDSALSGLTESDQLLLKMSVIAAAKPEVDTDYVKWFLETITSKPKMFVEAICFIDKFERSSPEFAYFTDLHIEFLKTKGIPQRMDYKRMHEECYEEGSTLNKLFVEVDYFNDRHLRE